MGKLISAAQMNQLMTKLGKYYDIYAPKVYEGEGCFSDIDSIRYGKVEKIQDIEFEKKSEYSFKEVFLPISETIFYYTQDSVTVPKTDERGKIIFLRSCDLHALKRLDDIYLHNGKEDFYYKRLRDNTKFILMGCTKSYDNCFCVSMGSNKSDNYDDYIKVENDEVYLECKWDELDKCIKELNADVKDVKKAVDFVSDNEVKVNIPKNLTNDVHKSNIWKEYSARCIACGRCNFVCPTCTCFTMQDIAYSDNERAGERRRVWASCHVDGFSEIAGGHNFRVEKGDRMRYKVMHKVHNHNKNFGHSMCVGCGRCDDVCPEYISFSACVNKLCDAMKEVQND